MNNNPEANDLPPAPGLCEKCELGCPVYDHMSGLRLRHCEKNQCGGALETMADGRQKWYLRCPLTKAEFVEALNRHHEQFESANPAAWGTLQ